MRIIKMMKIVVQPEMLVVYVDHNLGKVKEKKLIS